MTFSEFLKKTIFAVFLGLLFGIFAMAGGVVVARYTGLWELWEESRSAVAVQENAGERTNGLYETPKVELPESGRIQRTLPEEQTEAPKEEPAEPEAPGASGEEEKAESAPEAKAKEEAVYYAASDVTGVAAKVMPAVVAITNHYVETASFWGQTYQQEAEASGSGIIVGESSDEILLVTNYHVVESATKLTVVFCDETTAEAKIKGTARSMDLAVISVPIASLSRDTMGRIAVASLGDSDALVVGEPAIAIGNALGYGQSVTVGVISAVNRAIQGYENEEVGGEVGLFIQTDAAINPGNSGGALLNIRGEVIGINSNKLGGNSVEGMGYAIPISAARPIIAELMQSETRNRVSDNEKGFLGITGATVSEEAIQFYGLPEGVYITGIIVGSGADFAGLREGDVITSFDGQRVKKLEELTEVLSYCPVGAICQVEYMRRGQGGYSSHQVEVTLGQRQ